jgi:KaiC/GvpD/RAD55 family RecA-like ATPase
MTPTETDALVRIRSGISQAHWCDSSGTSTKYVPAELPFDTLDPQALSWFDKLLKGGLSLPTGEGNDLRPVTMLVSGPPGCGKTTLITELCYRLALNEQENNNEPLNTRALSTLYMSTDAETARMVDNAVDLGWSKARQYLVPFDPDDKKSILDRTLRSLVAVWGREKFLPAMEQQELLASIVESAVTSLDRWLAKADLPKTFRRFKYQFAARPVEQTGEGSERYIPDILVVDSLNILDPDSQVAFFQSFVKACKAKMLVVFILNTGVETQQHKLWEYFSDIVIQLDHEYVHDYYVRTIEVVKARYQSHWWGKHQLKIYPAPTGRKQGEGALMYNARMRRAHPYMTEGGVFVFPSIHSYLSVDKKRGASTEWGPDARARARDDTYPRKLNDVFQLPRGRCTAFIGERGGHKSHLGYLHLAHQLAKQTNEKCLIVSLREDEASTRDTLRGIARQEFGTDEKQFDQWEADGKLEVLYFPPGYITPEEFFHRVFISMHRLKRNRDERLTVLFNSLDQISARFPLCAKQEIFIPGIIQTLSGEGVTTICVAVDEPGQPVEQYGLLPMADLIVSFSRRRFGTADYFDHIRAGWRAELENDPKLRSKLARLTEEEAETPNPYREAVVLRVVRFSGGERAGRRGMLELVRDTTELDRFPYPTDGLQFTPLSEYVPEGDPVVTQPGRE